MQVQRKKDNFIGQKQIDISKSILNYFLERNPFHSSLYITNIGYYPNAFSHYRIRVNGCSEYILLYCVDGMGEIKMHDNKMKLTTNHFIIMPAHQFHKYQSDNEYPWTLYWIHFGGSNLDFLNKYDKPTYIRYNEHIISSWENIYKAISKELLFPNLSSANFLLYQFLHLFLFQESFPAPTSELTKMNTIIQYLKNNLDKILTIEDIAHEFGASSSHFSMLFKKETGFSPLDYFIKLKTNAACTLLDSTNLKVKEIALRLGYSDPYYFSRIFEKKIGLSPLNYRKNKLKDTAPIREYNIFC